MGQIAFVAGRFRQKSVEHGSIPAFVFRRHALLPQSDEEICGLGHLGHHLLEKRRFTTFADDFADSPKELSVTVMLHQPVNAIAVHHAGHKTVLALELGIPFEKFAKCMGQAGLGECRTHDHTIADP